MQKYFVYLPEVSYRRVEVEAESPKDAVDKATGGKEDYDEPLRVVAKGTGDVTMVDTQEE